MQAARPLFRPVRWWLVAVFSLLAACATPEIAPPALQLPQGRVGKAVTVAPGDPAYARAAAWNALKAPGLGGVSGVIVVLLQQDVDVYRAWNGPAVKDAQGRTNRLGSWWSAVPPSGSVGDYRRDYEVCASWNQLSWVARCRLRPGAVVAIGPGQSVSEQTCQSPGEAYPASPTVWQVYVDKPWARAAELDCSDESADYAADPLDLARRAQAR